MNINLKKGRIEIRSIQPEDVKELWEISYGTKSDLEWLKWSGPYFNNPILSWEEFSVGFGKDSINNQNRGLIMYDNTMVGIVTAYWEDGSLKQWLEIGIVIYDSKSWNKAIGKVAIELWLA